MVQKKHIKCVVVGDGAVGKTSMLMTYMTNNFPEHYVPTVFDFFSTDVHVGENTTVHAEFYDTAGQEDYDRLRPLSYNDTDVFILCFSLVNSESFNNVRKKWIYEISHYCPRVPFVLVGTQRDLRTAPNVRERLAKLGQHVVYISEGKIMAEELGAVDYVECSACTRMNIKQVFDTAILAAVKAKNAAKKFRACNFLCCINKQI